MYKYETALEVPEKILGIGDIMKFVREGNYKVSPYSAKQNGEKMILTPRKIEYDK